MNDIPALDPQKWGFADDDIMLMVDTAAAMRDPLANEAVNGAAAARAYREVTREFGRELSPDVTDTQFLSPTKAWPVLQRKYGITPEWPNYLYAWTAENQEMREALEDARRTRNRRRFDRRAIEIMGR